MNCDKKDLLLYAVTDRHWLDGRRLVDVVRESLDGGVTMVQLREKTLAEPSFLAEARELQALCRDYHVPFLVNDNVDIALAMDADGVHVGQEDLEAGRTRELLGPDKLIGVSAHSVEEALRLAPSTLLIRNGRAEAFGPTRDVLQKAGAPSPFLHHPSSPTGDCHASIRTENPHAHRLSA